MAPPSNLEVSSSSSSSSSSSTSSSMSSFRRQRIVVWFGGACMVMCLAVALMHTHYNEWTTTRSSSSHHEQHAPSSFTKQMDQMVLAMLKNGAKTNSENENDYSDASKKKIQRRQQQQQQKQRKDRAVDNYGTKKSCERRVPESENLLILPEDYVKNNDNNNDKDKNDDESQYAACTRYNSEAWLKGPRFGNAQDPLLTEDMIRSMLLDSSSLFGTDTETQSLLGQSLCYEQSRFRNDTETMTDDKSIRMWAVRLTYLAMHYHQHRLAIPEAVARFQQQNKPKKTKKNKKGKDTTATSSSCSKHLLDTYQVGNMDYECGTDSKYLLVHLGGNGLGANVRGGAVVGLVAALSLNRIVIFDNNSPTGKKGALQHPWPLASCPRRDYQCFYLPVTPCTLTHAEMHPDHVYTITSTERRLLYNKGIAPVGHEHDKVIRLQSQFLPQLQIPLIARQRLHQYAHALLDQFVPCDDPRLPAMRQGADLILIEGEVREGYNYAAAAQKVQHALGFYFLRPNLVNAKKIEHILHKIIPDHLNPETSIGLPIRASDKCKGESECLSFHQHMQVASDLWSKHQKTSGTNGKQVSVLFTTESKSMVAEQAAFASNKTVLRKFPFQFHFVTNTEDVTPDTGFFQEVDERTEESDKSTADQAMLSSISSFKAQLLPRVSIGNCCSNFHILLNDFLMEGCGAASDNTFLCLQETEDITLRVCCGWHKNCLAEKEQLAIANANAASAL